MPSAPPPNPRKWRFTWETLAHTPTLRLYLFNPDTDPSALCGDLSAALRLDDHHLLVSWVDGGGGGAVHLRVPVPKVLIDPVLPVHCQARQDHIEIKLTLVLPVDNPLVADLCRVLDPDAASSDRLLPLRLHSDLKSLSTEGVHFYCKNCSGKLTRHPLRRFVEMPSENWREAADNWFGACCCSFGGISEKLVSQYINNYKCAEGTCLFGGASVIVCKEDLEGYVFDNSDTYSSNSCKVDLLTSNVLSGVAKDDVSGNSGEDSRETCFMSSFVANKEENLHVDGDKGLPEYKNDSNSLSRPMVQSAECCYNAQKETVTFSEGCVTLAKHDLDGTQVATDINLLKLDASCYSGELENPISQSVDKFSSLDQCHCCVDNILNYDHGNFGLACSNTHGMVQQATISLETERSQRLHNSLLGSGFIFRNYHLSNTIKWVEFSCRHCSSFLGSYPSLKNTDFPLDGGVRLFKCHISTCASIGGLCDIFRKHTLQRVFTNSLLENAEDELSFRTIIRDLTSGSIMLQIVLLNSKAWSSTGYCFEYDAKESFFEADLQPVAKVLFSDCSASTEADSRIIENWSSRTHVEEMYMMKDQIEELTKCLRTAGDKLPVSCSFLQGMSLSFIER